MIPVQARAAANECISVILKPTQVTLSGNHHLTTVKITTRGEGEEKDVSLTGLSVGQVFRNDKNIHRPPKGMWIWLTV